MVKKRVTNKGKRVRVATRQDLTVRNRRAIDKQLEATKRSLMSHLSDLRGVIQSLEKRVTELQNTNKR